jgi:hypothetical protein
MRNTLLKQRTINVAFVVAAVIVAAFAAEGATQTENLLVSAGFQVKAAATVSQRQKLATLPKGRLSLVTQNKEPFYVYPDAQRNQIYVGNEANYQTYLDKVAIAGGNDDELMNEDIGRGQAKLPELSEWGRFDQLTN